MTRIVAKSEYGFKPSDPLHALFQERRTTPSPINEHLELLRQYAASSDVVCELGVDTGQSTTAFLAGQPKQLFSFDLRENPAINKLLEFSSFTKRCPNHIEAQIRNTFWVFTCPFDTSKQAVPACDLLFIDTWHAYPQLVSELTLNHERVRKWIIMHDVISFGGKGENWQDWEAINHAELKGLAMAIDDFMAQYPQWVTKEFYFNNNGLSVITRKL